MKNKRQLILSAAFGLAAAFSHPASASEPAVILSSGFLGGAGDSESIAVAVDGEGNTYVAGNIYPPDDFPVTAGAFDTSPNGLDDVFVAKLNVDGTALIYATYLGGDSYDNALDIAVDGEGNAYILGVTRSTEATFPVTSGSFDPTANGDYDYFVAKLNADGTALVYSGFLGGSSPDGTASVAGIAVDGSGAVYVTGGMGSADFSATPGAFDTTFAGGGSDAVAVKINADGSGLDYATFLGGSEFDVSTDIALDGDGNAYITGRTRSDEASFPVTFGPDLTFNSATGPFPEDGFVCKINGDGSGLVYCGYIGGADGTTSGGGIAVGGVGNAYLAGTTTATEASFPVGVGPDLTYNGGSFDVFVAKVKADGSGLDYAGYVGGSGSDSSRDIALDSVENAYLVGETDSTEASFPVSVGPDLTYNGGAQDVFFAKVKADGTGLESASYFGGSGSEFGGGLAVASDGNLYLAGSANSTEAQGFPVATGPDLTHNGSLDAFVVKLSNATTSTTVETVENGGGCSLIRE